MYSSVISFPKGFFYRPQQREMFLNVQDFLSEVASPMFERVSATECELRLWWDGGRKNKVSRTGRSKGSEPLCSLEYLGMKPNPPLQFTGSWLESLPADSAPPRSSGSVGWRPPSCIFCWAWGEHCVCRKQVLESKDSAPHFSASPERREIAPLFLYSWCSCLPLKQPKLSFPPNWYLSTKVTVRGLWKCTRPSFTAIHLCK